MNIEKPILKAGKWFANRRFIVKLLLAYVLCGLIPMLTMMAYYYQSTLKLLKERAYQDMRQDITIMNSSLNTAFQPYEIILENLKNDKDLNTLLSLNYSDLSYSDLAYYTNHTLDKYLALYPSVSRIRFFSNNDTLPQGYYFFGTEELGEETEEELEKRQESILASSGFLKEGKEILLVSRMNYYSSHTMQHFITLAIPVHTLSEIFYQENRNRRAYLLDSRGTILCSTMEDEIGKSFDTVLPGWEQNQEGEIIEAEAQKYGKMLCMKQSLDMGMTLQMVMEEDIISREARHAPMRMLMVAALLTILLLFPAVIYSHRTNRRLNNILSATERIGNGDFDWEMTSETTDELGQIANAVNHMKNQIDGLIRDNYQKQLALKISELNLLQEQINPHFLYNSLAVISSLSMREGAKETITSIRYLADFYRISLNKGRQILSVAEETELLKSYMKIQMIRFSDLVSISYDIDPAINDYMIIKLLLQPLVENAIHHAREEDIFLNIQVRGYRQEERLCFEVEDDGIGMDKETLEKIQEELLLQQDGFGLKNVDKRIKLNYGQEYGVFIYSEQNKGTIIHLEVPAVKGI